MQIAWSPQSLPDLRAIRDYIAKDSEQYADLTIARIFSAVERLLHFRENEISKEIDIKQVGAICLSCGHRQSKVTGLGMPQQFPPVEWEQQILSDASHPATAFEGMLNRTIR